MAITFKSVLASGGSGAVITVTYSAEFYNQTLTATNGTDTVTALATSAGTVDITVPSAGSWVVSCTVSGETYTSDTVSVDLSYSTELVAIPDGATVTPTDDVQTWLKCAGIKDKNYTTLSQVLADSVTFNALLGDSNACAYMARSTTWAATLCADQYAMSMIGQYDVCCDALLGNETWASAIINSSYADYVVNISVPTMTSNTAPSGVVSASSYLSNQDVWNAYRAFHYNPITDTSVDNRGWLAGSNVSNQWVQYEFPTAQVIKVWQLASNYGTGEKTFDLSASNDSTFATSTPLGEIKAERDAFATVHTLVLENDTAYKYYRVTIQGTTDDSAGGSRFQFYGHASSGEYIHGTNNESAYYLDNGTEVAIVDPSTLSAGTYTFGSTVAKDPSDLTADYRKSIRITPNTVEVVLRPDCALYWWGYKNGIENMSTANGWSQWITSSSYGTPSYNTNDISLSSSGQNVNGVATKATISPSFIHYVIKTTAQTSENQCEPFMVPNKSRSSIISGSDLRSQITSTNTMLHLTNTTAITQSGYMICTALRSTTVNCYALWYE